MSARPRCSVAAKSAESEDRLRNKDVVSRSGRQRLYCINMMKSNVLMDIYRRMYDHFGPRHWWPADSPFEVMIGAILTQNAAWVNVEKAISNLRKKRVLSAHKINRINIETLQNLIRPSGFYKEKAKKLKAFVKLFLSLSNVNSYNTKDLRKLLLDVKGIGPETADSILLYALEKPVFVIDAYTKRIFSRHGLIENEQTYDEIQSFFTKNIPGDRILFNEYHALIVEVGKNYCKKKNPLCKICPLKVVKPLKNMVYYKKNGGA